MTTVVIRKTVGARLLGPACCCILCGILYAGLAPFTAHPRNEVDWSVNPVGLWFGDYGMIQSSGPIPWGATSAAGPCSIEVWIEPGTVPDSNTFLAFYTRDYSIPFSLHQSGNSLVLVRGARDEESRPKTEYMVISHVFRAKRPSFLTITSDTRRTFVYVDGVLAASSPDLGLTSADITNLLELGNSPVANDSWAGLFRGLALYDSQLTASQVMDGYRSWNSEGRPDSLERARAVSLYAFREASGKLIHNEVSSAPDLYIPESYGLHGRIILKPFWQEFSWSSEYAKDVLINIAGFVPLGFCFCACLSTKNRTSHPVFFTILLGGTISLTIEILQAFIPTRDSGMTDVITNTLGTLLGALLCRWSKLLFLWKKLGISIS